MTKGSGSGRPKNIRILIRNTGFLPFLTYLRLCLWKCSQYFGLKPHKKKLNGTFWFLILTWSLAFAFAFAFALDTLPKLYGDFFHEHNCGSKHLRKKVVCNGSRNKLKE
jgi:hypothetical protein